MIKLKFPFLVFIVLLVGVAFASYRGGREKIFDRPEISDDKTTTVSPSPSAAYGDFPINPDSSGVTATYIHYYFTGIIKEINKTDTGGLIKLDINNDKIPEINNTTTTPAIRSVFLFCCKKSEIIFVSLL